MNQKHSRILMVGSIDVSAPNACAIHFFSLAIAFNKIGHEVEIIIPKPKNGEIIVPIEENNFKVHKIWSSKLLGLPNFINTILQIPFVLYYIYRSKIKILYVRMNVLSFLLIAFARSFTSVKIVTEHNGWLMDEGKAFGHPKWLCWIEKTFQLLDIRFSHLVRVVTPGLKNVLAEEGVKNNKIFVAGNGADFSRIYPISRENALEELGLDPKLIYLGFLGNLVRWQGLDLAINAMQKLCSQNPRFTLLIVGDGPERIHLEKCARDNRVEENVKFIGSVQYNRVNIYLNAFDIAIAPFTQTRNARIGLSPLKVKEYAAAGRIIVAADVLGKLESETAGWLYSFQPDSVEDFILKVNEAFKAIEQANRGSIGKTAREFAKLNYAWNSMAKLISVKIQDYITTV